MVTIRTIKDVATGGIMVCVMLALVYEYGARTTGSYMLLERWLSYRNNSIVAGLICLVITIISWITVKTSESRAAKARAEALANDRRKSVELTLGGHSHFK